MNDELLEKRNVLKEIKAIVSASKHKELKYMFQKFGFINTQQVGWNSDRFGNAPADTIKVGFQYTLKGGGTNDDCGNCFLWITS